MFANEVDYHNFNWENYILINNDLSSVSSKEEAWHHWMHHGYQEGRACFIVNNSRVHNARFGNLFFINLAVHFICIKSKLRFDYKYYDQFKNLGLELFVGDITTFDSEIVITDDNFFELVTSKEKISKNIVIKNDAWCQRRDFCIFLDQYFSLKKVRSKIIKKNIYSNRYSNNNDIFIHVRLGDIENVWNNSFEYYDNIIKTISFENGYISSDSIQSDICQKLIQKYNLNIINEDEVTTIMFASTCNNIVLSGGTFSWLIGFLAFNSKNIYYPKDKKNKWYGDIFIFPKWIGINE
jgi:hypothetical protein